MAVSGQQWVKTAPSGTMVNLGQVAVFFTYEWFNPDEWYVCVQGGFGTFPLDGAAYTTQPDAQDAMETMTTALSV